MKPVLWLGYLLSCTLLIACEKATGDYQLQYLQDGDSVILCCDKGKEFTVRLKDIDAPEKSQPFANESRQYLKQLITNKHIKLIGKEYDKYGRRLADIIIIEQDGEKKIDVSINKKMIESGHAWLWRYSESLKLQWLQKKARKEKRGLWALDEKDRIEPWLWRKRNRR